MIINLNQPGWNLHSTASNYFKLNDIYFFYKKILFMSLIDHANPKVVQISYYYCNHC